MMTSSLWAATAPLISFPSLSGETEADVVIVGGGITGITAAMELSESGKSVVVLEALTVGSGTTGYSTGNIYANLDSYLYPIREKWGPERAKDVAHSRRYALERIETNTARFQIDCGYRHCPLYLVALDRSQIPEMQKEYEALREAEFEVSAVTVPPIPLPALHGLRVDNQAQFHPLAYVRGLARGITSQRCRIFENSKAVDIDERKLAVATKAGRVKAGKIILATHTPKGFNLIQTELGPYREYGLAATLKAERYPDGIFWSMDKPGHSIRSYMHNGKHYLVVIGEKHKTGQHDPEVDYLGRVEEFTRTYFDVNAIEYRWSAQHYRPADHLPYIGRTASSKDIYIASGFETDGLIYGALAASIIADEICGKTNRWEELYKATRVAPLKGRASLVEENANVAKQYVKDFLVKAQVVDLKDIAPGQGGIVRMEGKQVAVYRDKDGNTTALSPFCTHLGCIVHWNGIEKSWDCPCHGSRFRWDGEVIEGPAISELQKIA
ncbi:FAD-dependent oxidoreductase [Geobacter sp. DSM 9736]|uniref:FAD-dependent oxidoreductase n=1 Tax=Geobacter sp. DSM 9736 TaxID=1277350 RepID=UPI000B5055AE|nr:FAD-dependent oxidoreductase [Geobacter sp. DSM 9736]SNB45166.1 Glycine/D-amino acid oxidase [Geobacter sp. DSM 9736]